MPYTEVMHKWGQGKLHSGSKGGPEVKSQKQAVAIMLSEKRAAAGGKKEYQPKGKASLKGLKSFSAKDHPTRDYRGEKNGQRI